ncbi:hypothetical protein SOCE26_069990 [Sorangium cellulosum]|uniref:Sortilin N-terminal domain-containing protein n=1 Tax=Sorangium cellulosum TaxID=56 RepID=A0A2L0F1V1_SORCE|nr:sialidase family protein [Sorangium cellulosum]AUX45507.1 hypothetical protein SOCE26_069990 [Sorangium cellulosum]
MTSQAGRTVHGAMTSTLLIMASALSAGCGGDGSAPGAARGPESARLASEARGAISGARGAWQPRGVGGGGALFSPSISPHDRREIFMASDLLGVFHTTSFGREWTTLDFREIRGGILSQFRFTADPKVLYAVGHTLPLNAFHHVRTLIKSTDGGATWDAPVTMPAAPGDGHFLFVDPRSTERLLFSGTAALYFSSDGGATFRSVYTTAWPGGLVVGGVHWDGADIHAGTSDGLLVSRDGGATFAVDVSVDGIPPGEKIVSFAGAGRGAQRRFFAITFSAADSAGSPRVTAETTGLDLDAYAGLYRLPPGQTRWTPATNGLGPDDKLSFVAMSDDHPRVAYVAGGDRAKLAPVVLKTVDGGERWEHALRTDHNTNVATGWSGYGGDMSWEFGEYALGLSVSPRDPDRLAFTDLGFVHVSDDGGKTFQQAYVRPADENRKGEDTTMSRSYRTSGVEQTSCWWLTFTGPKTLFASFTDIRSAFSEDGGKSWSRDGNNGLSLNTTYHAVQHPVTGALYAATASVHDLYQSPYLRDARIDGTAARPARGAVMVSHDKGASWSLLADLQRPVIWLALDPNDPSRLYASTVNSATGGVVRLDLDAPGAAPAALPAPPRTQGHAYNVHVLKDGSVVATYSGHQPGNTRTYTERSGVFLLRPGAAAWEDRSAPEMRYWTKDVVIDPNDPTESTWYVTVFSHDDHFYGGLYRTRDRGATWRRISQKYRVESCAIDPRDPDRMYMTTQREGLWLTENLNDETPTFRPVEDYPSHQPVRVFWNPYRPGEVWTVSFGGGMRVKRER